MNIPELTFYCELKSEFLVKLFENRFVLDDLKTLKAKLSLGILDFSNERAQVIKKLNKFGIPVIAWLLLPEEDGYWFNADNYLKAGERYDEFIQWTKENKLDWDGIGLDIEPDINFLKNLREKKIKMLPGLIKRFSHKKQILEAQLFYRKLVEKMHLDGYKVESYHIPLIIDERKADSTVLQRVIGLVDLNADKEVLMLYSSFLRPRGNEVLWQYASEAGSIGIGNTGGGVDLEGVIDIPPLTWDEFSQDLRTASKFGKPVHIFCLEGCVAQGFLERLITFKWDEEPSINDSSIVRIGRKGIQALLWTIQRPWVILATSLSLFSGLLLLKKKKKKSK